MLSLSQRYKRLPSEILGIEDTYTAFCFNEACDYLMTEIEKGNKPTFTDVEENMRVKARRNSLDLAAKLRDKKRGD